MGPYYKVYCEIEFPSGERMAAKYAIAQELAIEFRPYDKCDRSVDALVTGGLTTGMADICDKERKRLAERIAHDLTAHIMASVKAKDTVNGYPQNHSHHAEPRLRGDSVDGVVGSLNKDK